MGVSAAGRQPSPASLDVLRPGRRRVVFLATFVAAWLLLDRLVTSPPTLLSASVALAASSCALFLGQRALGVPWPRIPASLGLGRPVGRALVVAAAVGGAYFLSLLAGAQAVGVTLELRSNWPVVLVTVLLFHGLAEELVWRGFAFAHLRRTATFRRAVLRSMPLIVLTHVPIVVTNGPVVGLLALVTAATTCLPLAYLWERGGMTVWAPALLHGLVGTWQLFERSYPVRFSVVMLLASIAVPMLAFVAGDRFFARPPRSRADARALRPSPGGTAG